MKQKTTITARGFVPDGAGGYRPYDDLGASERKAFGERLVQRMGDTINRYASVNPEAIPCIARCAAVDSESEVKLQ